MALVKFNALSYQLKVRVTNEMYKLLATRQIELNERMTDMPTAENSTQMFYEVLDLNKAIRTYINSILDHNVTTQHDVHEDQFNAERLLAVCTDTWYLIACITDQQKPEEHLSDLFTLAYDIEQSQDAMYEQFF